MDVKRHIGGSQHQKLAKDVAATTSIDTFYVSGGIELEKVTNAEVLFTGFILEHNLPFECSSRVGPLFRKMFPDSKIAAKYGCAATKTACIINHAIAPSLHSHLLDLLRAEPFSLSVDGSSDTGTESMYPLVVKVYDINRGEISSLFWNMALISDCSAAGIFQKVSDIFEKESIPWENCIGLSLDNACVIMHVNMRKYKGLFTRFMKKNDSIYTFGCPCHIIHNTAKAGSDAFAGETGFDVGDFLVDLFYYFDNSTKRLSTLKEFCDFCDQEYRKILKYGATRWLSKELCITRVLKQYKSLEAYFNSQNSSKSDKRLTRLKAYFEDNNTEVYLMFYQSVLPLFSNINKTLQSEEPKIHLVKCEVMKFLNSLLGRFMKVEYISELSKDDVIDPTLYLDKEKVMIGFATRAAMRNKDFLPMEEARIVSGAIQFMQKAYLYGRCHFPLTDPVVEHAAVLQIQNRRSADFQSVLYFIERFPTLKILIGDNVDNIYDQFVAYQLLPDSTFPKEERIERRKNHIWHTLNGVKNASGSQFNLLFDVAKFIMVLPHSNAAEERIFSTVAKNKTKFRASLSNEITIPSILTCKSNFFNHTDCFKYVLDKKTLVAAKKATVQYNKK